jgi:ATP-dependent DNA helicase RecG
MAALQTPPAKSILAAPVTTLWGVGGERAKQLARLEIHTVEELLLHRPRRYEDRRNFRAVKELKMGEAATVRGKIIAAGVKRWRKGERALFECVLDDGTAHLYCRWWQAQPWLDEHFATGREFLVFGKPESLRPRTIDHPETELVEEGEESFVHFNRIVPIYPVTEGLPQRWLRGLIWRTLEKYQGSGFRGQGNSSAATESAGPVALHLVPRAQALRMLHFPDTIAEAEIARKRLALDEFLALQIQIRARRSNFEARSQALPCAGDNRLIKPFLAQIGFKLTTAQTKVLREIRRDMSGAHPMRRLLQGDVGSGKTAVAACAALMALESGFHVTLMAPTEILAEQHFRNFTGWLGPLGVRVEIQTGSRRISDTEHRTPNIEGTEDGHHASRLPPHASLFIGTHALLESSVAIPNLGLVIIDEQHKFGVAQREQLVRKGRYPHLLVMTATPIPRTLGLTLYGDLDVSVIDELPPGRGRLKTFVRLTDALPKVWSFIREKLSAGRQAYVVYPRVEDNVDGFKAVTKEFENLKTTLAPFPVGLLHGRLGAREKEQVMAAFRANTVKVLLATSLIEVGVDVANATVMLIENAEAFGLAQLHQLRGRIGRGAHESYCILISDATHAESRSRLRVLEETSDGFRIAEADLKLRGPGDLLGRQQSGLPRFRFGDLSSDLELIRRARELAAQLAR